MPQPTSLQSDLLVEDHVDSVGFDVNGVLSHELQDIFDAGGVGQATEADTVASVAGCWKEGRRGEDRDGHDGWRGQCGDQRCWHIAVQDLANTTNEKDGEKSKRYYCHFPANAWNPLRLNVSWDEDHKVSFTTVSQCQREAWDMDTKSNTEKDWIKSGPLVTNIHSQAKDKKLTAVSQGEKIKRQTLSQKKCNFQLYKLHNHLIFLMSLTVLSHSFDTSPITTKENMGMFVSKIENHKFPSWYYRP